MTARKIFAISATLVGIIWTMAAEPTPSPRWEKASEPAPADTVKDKDKPRYSVRRTGVDTHDDLTDKAIDLRNPDNLQTDVNYDEGSDTYQIGSSLGSGT
ncbi:MAG: hypothetical protein HUK03_07810, partial [Bacteroidaceae bacterium]|nr:hypothetical protein [Bacteroidaceae bacterium]